MCYKSYTVTKVNNSHGSKVGATSIVILRIHKMPKVEEVLFTREGRMELEVNSQIAAASAVMRRLHRSEGEAP